MSEWFSELFLQILPCICVTRRKLKSTESMNEMLREALLWL